MQTLLGGKPNHQKILLWISTRQKAQNVWMEGSQNFFRVAKQTQESKSQCRPLKKTTKDGSGYCPKVPAGNPKLAEASKGHQGRTKKKGETHLWEESGIRPKVQTEQPARARYETLESTKKTTINVSESPIPSELEMQRRKQLLSDKRVPLKGVKSALSTKYPVKKSQKTAWQWGGQLLLKSQQIVRTS